MKHSCMAALLAGVASVTINLPSTAQEQASSDVGTLDQGAAEKLFPTKRAYSPYAGRSFPNRPFFGDTHLHTSFSFDAGAFGARLGPVDAYRFAKGEQVTASSGQPAKLSRPLDFLVVADHSDNMGFFPDLLAAKPNIMADPTGRKWHDMIVGGQGAAAAIEIIVAFSQNKFPKALLYSPDSSSYRSAWQETIRAAEQANEPGRSGSTVNSSWNNTVREPRRIDSAAAAKPVRRPSVAKAARGTAKRSRSGATAACPRHAPIDRTGGEPPAGTRCGPTISICSGGSSSPAAAKSGA